MRCLLVEDEALRIEEIKPELEKHFGAGNVEVAEDRDAAIAQISARAFDLIVLDQKIPTAAGQLDPDVEHGRAVLAYVQENTPDTPVYFFTALSMDDDYISDIIRKNRRCDIWGDRSPIVLVDRFNKANPLQFSDAVQKITTTARVTEAIEINTRGSGITLDESERHLLRCFARRQNGACVDVEMLSDGLSDANVLKVNVRDEHGNVRLSAAGKIGPSNIIGREIACYEPEVSRLLPANFAPMFPGEMPRIGGKHGVFYRLTEGFDRSLFEVLFASDTDGAACVRGLQAAQSPWFNSKTAKRIRVSELAEMIIRKERLADVHGVLGKIDWERFEYEEISVYICTRHGDLHGENARVARDNRVMLIDYGSIRSLPSAMDAITLELSPFFHPHGHRDFLRWSASDDPIDWFNKDAFHRLSDIPTYMGAARGWAHAEAYADREVVACAYAYALRQISLSLTNPDWSDRDLAVAIATGIITRGMP